MSSGRALEVQHFKCPSLLLQQHIDKIALLLPIYPTYYAFSEHRDEEGYKKQDDVQNKGPLPTDLGMEQLKHTL